jgi:hypothetical protein
MKGWAMNNHFPSGDYSDDFPKMAYRFVGYLLDKNHNPVPCYDLMEWAKAFEFNNRIVAKTSIKGLVRVGCRFS